VVAVLSCNTAPPLAPVASNDTFVVRLHRPAHVGDRWHVVVDGTSRDASSTYTQELVVKKSDKRVTVHFDANALARATSDGVVTQAEYVITAFERGDNHEVVVAPGKHVVVTTAPQKADARVLVDGEPASADVREALDVALPLAHGPGNEDMLFGTDQPQRVGSAWPIHIATTKDELLRNGVIAREEAIHGTVTLTGTKRVRGVDWLDVRIDLRVDAFTPVKPLPEGTQITTSTVLMKATSTMPASAAVSGASGVLDVHTEFEGFVPVQAADITGVTVDTKTDLHRSVLYEPL